MVWRSVTVRPVFNNSPRTYQAARQSPSACNSSIPASSLITRASVFNNATFALNPIRVYGLETGTNRTLTAACRFEPRESSVNHGSTVKSASSQ